MDYSPPGSSIHGIFQPRILEWVVISFSMGSSQLRGRTWVFHIASGCSTIWATRETRQEWVNLIQMPIISATTLYPGGSAGKESTYNVGDLGWIPALGRYPGEGKGYPFQYSGPVNSWTVLVHGVAKSYTWPSNFYFISLHFMVKPVNPIHLGST